MAEVIIRLPDELARQAEKAGLLSDSAMQKLLEDAIRREAGRRLLAVADQLHAADIQPLSEEDIIAEVKSVRAERRTRRARTDDAGRS